MDTAVEQSTQVGYEFAINYCARLHADPATITDFYHTLSHARSCLLTTSHEEFQYYEGTKEIAEAFGRLQPQEVLTLVAQVDVQPVAASSLMLRLAGVQSVQQRPFRGFQQVLVITCVDTWWKIGGDLHCWLHNTPKSWITSAQQHFAQHAIPMSADDEDGIHGDVAPQGDSKHPSSKPDGVAAAQPASPTHVDAITTHQPPTQSPAAPPTPPVPDNPTNDDTTPDEDPNHDTMNNNNDASKQDAPVDASPAAPALTYAQRVKANLQQQAGGTSTNGGGGAGGVGSSGSVGMARHGGQRTSASMHSAASSERGGGHEGHDGRRGFQKSHRSDERCGLMVRNLPSTITDADLHTLFGGYGKITDTHIRGTHDGRAYAFVVFSDEAPRNAALHDPPMIEGKPAVVVEKKRGVGRGGRRQPA